MVNVTVTYKFRNKADADQARRFICQTPSLKGVRITQTDNVLDFNGNQSDMAEAAGIAEKLEGLTTAQIAKTIVLIQQKIPKAQAALNTLMSQRNILNPNTQAVEISNVIAGITLAKSSIKSMSDELNELQNR